MSKSTCIRIVVFLLATFAGRASAEGAAGGQRGDFGLELFGGRAKIAAVPIPAYNESIGWSLGLATAAFYRVDEADSVSPESMTALFGLYAENKTWMTGAYQKFHLDEDRWRIEAGGAYGRINFQTFADLPGWLGGGTFIGYESKMTFAVAKGSRLTWRRLYLGAKYRYMRTHTVFKAELPVDLDTGAKVISGLGAVAAWDSRDNIFYPLKGYCVDFGTLWNRDWTGSDQDYDVYEFAASGYREYREGHVIAARLHSRVADGDVPFEDESVLFGVDLRGYTDGRYRADQRHTFQAEYRWNFRKLFSAVGFGGFGFSVDKLSGITWDGMLPSAGVGLRWRMISDPPVNIGVDYAWGREERAFYFRIGEAF